MPTLADVLLAGAGGTGGNFGTMSPGEEAVAVTPGSVLDALARKSYEMGRAPKDVVGGAGIVRPDTRGMVSDEDIARAQLSSGDVLNRTHDLATVLLGAGGGGGSASVGSGMGRDFIEAMDAAKARQMELRNRGSGGLGGGGEARTAKLAPLEAKGSFGRLADETFAGWQGDKARALEEFRDAAGTNPNRDLALTALGENPEDWGSFSLGSGNRKAAPVAAPALTTRANPTPADIEAIYNRVATIKKDAPWPDAANPVFATTPEAYAETAQIVPQQSVRDRLPQMVPAAEMPLGGRTVPITENAAAIGNRIADRLAPLVERQDPSLKFYHTGPVYRGLEEYAGLDPATTGREFVRDWAGQGAATSPRTATPSNLRNSSYLLHRQNVGDPFTVEQFRAEGNRPGYGMMGMHARLGQEFATGTENLLRNPKPGTFREAWSGNMADVVADSHNIRGTLYEFDQMHPGQLPPAWFNSVKDYETYRAGGGFPKDTALNVGAIKDTLEGVTRKGVESQVEYPAMQAPWQHAAEQLGIHPAEAQSGGWFDYGGITGLRSPPKTVPNLLNDQIEDTARTLGVPPQKIIEWWGQRKIPLTENTGDYAGPLLQTT